MNKTTIKTTTREYDQNGKMIKETVTETAEEYEYTNPYTTLYGTTLYCDHTLDTTTSQ